MIIDEHVFQLDVAMSYAGRVAVRKRLNWLLNELEGTGFGLRTILADEVEHISAMYSLSEDEIQSGFLPRIEGVRTEAHATRQICEQLTDSVAGRAP